MNPTKTKKKKTETSASTEVSTPVSKPAVKPASPRIRLDETNAKLAYANFFNVSSTREETALMFGMIQASANPREEVSVEVCDRVVITPRAAKRLQTMLGQVLTQYESRFGPLRDEAAAR
ncbi:MAG: DUF3467 domain-containing protein [Chthoniobacteraceae bacterium]